MKRCLGNRLRVFLIRRQQKRQLLEMDERMRHDLAISRVDAEQLAGRFHTTGCHQLPRGERRYV